MNYIKTILFLLCSFFLTSMVHAQSSTNKSGITHAELMYRTDGGQWQRVDLTSNGNRWYGSIPANALKSNSTVEYYIQATSGNGKTITKPFTAHQGGYFSFALSTDTPYDAGMFDFNTKPMPIESITFTLSDNWIREDTSEDNPTGIIVINDLGTK